VKIIQPKEGEILDIELEESLLAKNKNLANENRKILDNNGVIAIDVMGSIGSGKTSLIKNIIKELKGKYKIGVIAGDLTTEIDAKRLKKGSTQVLQVNTGKECHLDANLIKRALGSIKLDKIDILFIENVGNLICPGEFPLGAHKRIVVISVTEGQYMVVKHPFIFREAEIVAINKIDLKDSMKVSPAKLKEDVLKINKKAKVVQTNCMTGEGIREIIKCMNFQ
jgi:hydrogenase nickel incorporation protein HypB